MMRKAEPRPLFKDGVDPSLVDHYAKALAKAARRQGVAFSKKSFAADCGVGLSDMELKARIKHLAAEIWKHLGRDYLQGLGVMMALVADEQANGLLKRDFAYWPVAQFIEDYGVEHPKESIAAMEKVTEIFTCEFAIRPFLQRYRERTLKAMHRWAKRGTTKVRRNASEGIRPRLPWGLRLQDFVRDPRPVFEVLEHLRHDPDEYVRRSVSNCLNDVAKDHPAALMELLGRWDQDPDANSEWIKGRALRTLVKAGNPKALKLLGYGPPKAVVTELSLDRRRYRVGDTMEVSFVLQSQKNKSQRLMVDYRVHYVRANGDVSAKVFKLKTLELKSGEHVTITKRQHLKAISTRRYYPGKHLVDVQVNGKVMAEVAFDLSVP